MTPEQQKKFTNLLICVNANEFFKDREDISFEYRLGFDAAIGWVIRWMEIIKGEEK